LKNVGFTTTELKIAIYTIRQLKGAGFSVKQLLAAPYTKAEILNATINISNTNTNLRLWLDANDPYAYGIQQTTNILFDKWSDKSSYKNHAIALTNTDTPTSFQFDTKGFNTSYPTFSFTAKDRKRFTATLTNGANIIGNSTRVFIIGSLNDTSEIYGGAIGFSNIYKANDYNSYLNWIFRRQSNTGMGACRNNIYTANNPSSYNIPLIWEAWFDGTKQNSKFLNGNSTTIISTNSTGNFNLNHYTVGSNTNPDNIDGFFSGNISEILVYNSTLTSIEVDEIEGYLAWKWGLSATLPDSHTFKNGSALRFPVNELKAAGFTDNELLLAGYSIKDIFVEIASLETKITSEIDRAKSVENELKSLINTLSAAATVWIQKIRK
jgi:hypothetical protein